MTTNVRRDEASAAEVYHRYCLRDGVEHFYKTAKHELGWADFQVRPARAIICPWQLVMLAFTFSLLAEAPRPEPTNTATCGPDTAGKKISGGTHRLERDAATRATLVVPLGAPAVVLAAMVHRPTAAGTGRPPRPRRALAAS